MSYIRISVVKIGSPLLTTEASWLSDNTQTSDIRRLRGRIMHIIPSVSHHPWFRANSGKNISHYDMLLIIMIRWQYHYNDVIMGDMASQITSLTIVYTTVYSGTDKRKHQSSASLAFMRGIHRWPVNSPHKWPATRKMFPFHDVIMLFLSSSIPIWSDFIICFPNVNKMTTDEIRTHKYQGIIAPSWSRRWNMTLFSGPYLLYSKVV